MSLRHTCDVMTIDIKSDASYVDQHDPVLTLSRFIVYIIYSDTCTEEYSLRSGMRNIPKYDM